MPSFAPHEKGVSAEFSGIDIDACFPILLLVPTHPSSVVVSYFGFLVSLTTCWPRMRTEERRSGVSYGLELLVAIGSSFG